MQRVLQRRVVVMVVREENPLGPTAHGKTVCGAAGRTGDAGALKNEQASCFTRSLLHFKMGGSL